MNEVFIVYEEVTFANMESSSCVDSVWKNSEDADKCVIKLTQKAKDEDSDSTFYVVRWELK